MDIYFKSIIGIFVVWALIYVSKSKNYYIAGLIPLFPTFALIAHFSVYFEQGSLELKETALFGMFSLISYFIYLFIFYFSVMKTKFLYSILLGLLGWLISAFITLYLWSM